MKKQIISFLFIICLLITMLTGCGDKNTRSYKIYYLDVDKTCLIEKEYEPQSTDQKALVEEFLNVLSKDTNSVEYIKPIPSLVSIKEYKIIDNSLSINFSSQYEDIDGVEEVLTRSAIVKTLLQIDGIEEVSFYVSGQPLVDNSGTVISKMTVNSFLDYSSDNNSSLEKTTVDLYYSSMDGLSLIKESQDIYYDKRVSLEKVVLDSLMKNPKIKNAKVAIPENTKVIYSTVFDGVCYLTLDSTLIRQSKEVSNNVIIYSIVNSLCSLDNINKVVIKVQNDSVTDEQSNLDIEGEYQSDYSLVSQEVKADKEIEGSTFN